MPRDLPRRRPNRCSDTGSSPLAQPREWVVEGLVAGSLGIGSTLVYMRDGVSPREFFELQRLADLYGRQTGAHFRYTPGTDTTEANGIQELSACR